MSQLSQLSQLSQVSHGGTVGQNGTVGQYNPKISSIPMITSLNKYPYHLDTSSAKHICPRCQRKTFVLYVDEYNRPLSEEVGKCDRKDKCNWHYSPTDYRRDHGATRLQDTGSTRMQMYRPQPTLPTQIVKPSFIDPDLVSKTCGTREYCDVSLFKYLMRLYADKLSGGLIADALIGCGVGVSKLFGGSPVFWQIDRNGKIRTGKIMGYDETTGKRVKEPTSLFKWVHKELSKSERYGGVYSDFRLQQCFFNSHNIESDDTPLWLFESEKAVLIVELALRWLGGERMFTPVACGGCGQFNPTPERLKDPYNGLQALKGRRVVLFPDEGLYDDWRAKGTMLKGFCKEVYISTVMERERHPAYSVLCDIEKGDALDDIIIRYINAGRGGGEVADLLLTSYGYSGDPNCKLF